MLFKERDLRPNGRSTYPACRRSERGPANQVGRAIPPAALQTLGTGVLLRCVLRRLRADAEVGGRRRENSGIGCGLGPCAESPPLACLWAAAWKRRCQGTRCGSPATTACLQRNDKVIVRVVCDFDSPSASEDRRLCASRSVIFLVSVITASGQKTKFWKGWRVGLSRPLLSCHSAGGSMFLESQWT